MLELEEEEDEVAMVTLVREVSKTRNASIMVTVPEPSSSAPGAARREGRKRLMESWCAPTMIVLGDWPGMVAMMLDWPQEWGKASTRTPCEASVPEAEIVLLMVERSQAEDSAPDSDL